MSEQYPDKQNRPQRSIRSFVVRAGRMTTAQQKGWDDHSQDYLLSPDVSFNPEQVFGRKAPLVFEVGFGMGQSLVEMAENFPEHDFIGVEVHRPGVGSVMHQAGQKGLSNLRLYCHDAIEVLENCIQPSQIHRFQLYFPDPWHKKKHHKRRIVNDKFLSLLHRVLEPSGLVHMATDWVPYSEHMLETLNASEGFENTLSEGDFAARPSFRPETRFEQRGHRLGHEVRDLLWRKCR